MSQTRDQDTRLNLLQVIGSVLAAFFGVQKDETRERDLARGTPGQFIAVGLIGTAIFVLTVIGVVRLVMYFVG